MLETLAIGYAVRAMREKKGWKAKDLAAATDLADYDISKIETGQKRLDFATATRLTQALGVSLDDLSQLSAKMSHELKQRENEQIVKAVKGLKALRSELLKMA